MTVFVASEFKDDACRHAAVLAHEMKHVAVYKAYLADARTDLAGALPQVVDAGLIRAIDASATQQEVQRTLGPFLDRFLQRNGDEIAVRQSAIDTAEEYARVEAMCANEPRV
jgi:predicted Zn-dependent protease